MRKIKFRAWDSYHKKMEYGSEPFIYTTHSERKIGIGFDLDPDFYHKNNDCIFDKHIMLMQYIGLRDKNGKEIYEGDIVIFDNTTIGGKKYEGEIVFNDDQTLGNLEWGLWTKKGYLSTDFLGHIEVIGNICENEELL